MLINSREAAVEMIAENELKREQCVCIRTQMSILMNNQIQEEMQNEGSNSLM